MSTRIDQETLVSYVDGQLSARENLQVEAALAENDAARATVRELREGGTLLRAAFNEPMNEPVPARVLEAFNQAVAAQASGRADPVTAPRSLRSRRWPMAVAASFAALMIGLSVSFFLANQRVEQQLAVLQAMAEQDRVFRDEALTVALEKYVSGESVDWRNPDSGRGGSITPVRTFKSSGGQWCREYAASQWLGDKQDIERAIACRDEDGSWKTRLVLMTDS